MSSSRTLIAISGAGLALVALGAAFALDHEVNRLVRDDIRTDAVHAVARLLSLLGTGAFFVPLLAVMFLRGWVLDDRRLLRIVLLAAVALLLAGLVSPSLKLIFSRIRPHDPGAGTFRLFAFASADSSFPSGHTMAAFALAGVLAAAASSRVRIGILAAASLVPLARVAGGRHFLADVVAGAVIGLLLSSLAAVLVRAWRRRRNPE